MGTPGQKSSMAGFMARGRSLGMTKPIGKDDKGLQALAVKNPDTVKAMGYDKDETGAILRGGAHIKPIMRMASGPAGYGSSSGMQDGLPRYNNRPSPATRPFNAMDNLTTQGGLAPATTSTPNLSSDSTYADGSSKDGGMESSGKYQNPEPGLTIGSSVDKGRAPGASTEPVKLGKQTGQGSVNLNTTSDNTSGTTPSSVANSSNLQDTPLNTDMTGKRGTEVSGRSVDESMSQGREQSTAIYDRGVNTMNAGKDALETARNMTTGPGSASNKERRSSMKAARKTIKSGRKDRNSGNKKTVIRTEFGKTTVNNRAANAAAGGGTKVGNLIRSVFGGRKNPSKRQNTIS